MVAGVVFAVVLTLTLVRSILVVDAVTSPPGVYSCLAARATHAVSSRIPVDAAQGRSGASPQQRGSTGTSTAVRCGTLGAICKLLHTAVDISTHPKNLSARLSQKKFVSLHHTAVSTNTRTSQLSRQHCTCCTWVTVKVRHISVSFIDFAYR